MAMADVPVGDVIAAGGAAAGWSSVNNHLAGGCTDAPRSHPADHLLRSDKDDDMATINDLTDVKGRFERTASRIDMLYDYGLDHTDVEARINLDNAGWSQLISLDDMSMGTLSDLADALFTSADWLLTGRVIMGKDPLSTPDPMDVRTHYCRCLDPLNPFDTDCPIHGRSADPRFPLRPDIAGAWAVSAEKSITAQLARLDITEHELAEAHGFTDAQWGDCKTIVSIGERMQRFFRALDPATIITTDTEGD